MKNLFLPLCLLLSYYGISQDSITWKQINGSRYSFKYPEGWKVNFKDDSRDGFIIEIYEKSNRKAVATVNFTGQKMWQKQSPEEIIENKLIGYNDSVKIFYQMDNGGIIYDTVNGVNTVVSSFGPQTDQPPLYTLRLIKFGWEGNGPNRRYYYETRVEPGTDPKVTNTRGISCCWFADTRTYCLSFSDEDDVFEKYKPIVESIIASISVNK